MARFRANAAFHIKDRRIRAGTLVCDGTACNAGDFIWSGLNASNYHPDLQPLDAAANAIKAASQYANVGSRVTCTGVDRRLNQRREWKCQT